MKEKKLPSWIKNRYLYRIFQSRPGRIFTNWVLQGMLYMNPVEVAYKLMLDAIMAAAIWVIFFSDAQPAYIYIIIAIFFAHTVNWLINCQIIALIRHLDWGRNDPYRFIRFIEGMHGRIRSKGYLSGCAAYGGLSVGRYSPTSDIDIRVIMRPGLINKLLAANFCFIERVRAAIDRFPLDLYAFTLDEVQIKMSPKEPPIVFHDPDGLLDRTYREIVPYEDFRQMFHQRLTTGEFSK